MSKFKVVNIIDLIFITFAIFLLVFAWIQFFIGNIVLSLLLSAIITLSAMLIKRYFSNRKYNATMSLLNYQSQLTKFKIALQTLPNTKLNSYIKKLLPAGIVAKIEKGNIVFMHNNQTYTILTNFSKELSENKLFEIIKNTRYPNIVVICNNISLEAGRLSKTFENINIELITIEQLYQLFDKHEIQINTDNINISTAKLTLKDILKGIIARPKSKGYFIAGIILLFSGLLVPFKIYYLVSSSVLLILSLMCRLKPVVSVDSSILK